MSKEESMDRETIVRLKDKWTRKLEEFDREAEKAKEVYVWILREKGIEKVKINCPSNMDFNLSQSPGEYHLDNEAGDILSTKTEGVWWFRSEEAALEEQKWPKLPSARAEEPDQLISLRKAREVLRCFGGPEGLNRLPRHPVPDGKMVPLEAVEKWLVKNGYHWCSHAIGAGLKWAVKD